MSQWIPFYIGDYERDTKMLSQGEHGAYFALLRHCWATGQPVPLEDRDIFRISGAFSDEEKENSRRVLALFFTKKSTGFFNKKAIEIAKKQQENLERSRKNGALGGRPAKPRNNPGVNLEITQGVTQKKPNQIQNQIQKEDFNKSSSSPTPPLSKNKPWTKKKTFFSIKRNGVQAFESDWILQCLHRQEKRAETGLSLDEFLQLYPSTEKTFNRWMAHDLELRMAAYHVTLTKTNAKNELVYALSLLQKSKTDLTIFNGEIEHFKKAVEQGDLEIEIDV